MKYFVTYIYTKNDWFHNKTKVGNAVVEVEPPMSLEKIRQIETALKEDCFSGGKIVLQNFIPLEDTNED